MTKKVESNTEKKKSKCLFKTKYILKKKKDKRKSHFIEYTLNFEF